MSENNHSVSKCALKGKISRQGVLDESVKRCYPSSFHNWPPKIRTKEEVAELCKPIIAWLEKIYETDEIFKYNDIKDLAGSAGYVAFRNSKQISAYCVMRS